ncbi:MAG: hypothetical protein C5B50_24940 [Verrucomicrobia bacterium]|nr:MAG: hypothetical protein C5B50_24940 [Verrucomicrobiota bacterium]
MRDYLFRVACRAANGRQEFWHLRLTPYSTQQPLTGGRSLNETNKRNGALHRYEKRAETFWARRSAAAGHPPTPALGAIPNVSTCLKYGHLPALRQPPLTFSGCETIYQTMTRELPSFLRDLIAVPPRAGQGVHGWLFRAARQLHAHYPGTEIVRLLREAVRLCGRQVPDSEILAAVQNSLPCAWQPRGYSSVTARPATAAKWPAPNLKRIQALCSEGCGLADLWECSPIRMEDTREHTETIIDALFPGNPLLCCGKSKSEFDTKPREDWRGQLAALQLIVPSPMTAIEGVTKEGKPSKHALSNTGPRRFLVCEFDKGTLDNHAALLLHLAGYAPMIVALHSGGKSMHSWFFIQGLPEDKVLKFFRYAVTLGADSATWTRSQFVRMPDGTRDSGKRQTVFFLSLKPLQGHDPIT